MAQLLRVRIITPKEVIFDNQATSVSSTNSAGRFDILPKHANFITIIENTPIIVRQPHQKPLTFNFKTAIIYNTKDTANIYTDIPLK